MRDLRDFFEFNLWRKRNGAQLCNLFKIEKESQDKNLFRIEDNINASINTFYISMRFENK
ncbi:hypothetical protein BSYN_28370 [Bacteroides sedimenti]|uniref:Uncharacterized protein n=1 Tax=Bacteroides sedimenti TaxID=2136147 RepID=A0ABM8IKG8_9BACE